MNESHTIQESMKNLYAFEYYSFKKTFSNAFIMIGVGFFLIILGVYLNEAINNSLLGYFGFYIELLILFGIFLYLGRKITLLRKSSYENGILFKLKTPLGWFLALFGIFFLVLEELLLPATRVSIFLASYFDVYALLSVYYLNKRIFFPKENNKALKRLTIGVLFFLIIHYISLLIISSFIPHFFGPYQLGNTIYIVSPLYWRINNLVTVILLVGVGLLIGREAKSLGRVVNEE